MSADKAKTCPHCGSAMASTGAPIWEDYCTNKRCTVARDRLFASLRDGMRRSASLHHAAPELLDALKAARQQVVTLGGDVVVDSGGKIVSDAIQAAVLNVIDAAISKAEAT